MKKYISLVLAAVILICSLSFLAGCADGSVLYSISPSAEDTKVVGTVGDSDILYDELRFITLNYRYIMEEAYGDEIWENPDTAEQYREELEKSVLAALTVNIAALKTAEKHGIKTVDKSVKDFVTVRLNSLASELADAFNDIDNPTDNNVNTAYEKYLKENFLTDRYNRYTLSIDGCVEQLKQKLIADGTLVSDDATVTKYINENFVRTYHVFVPSSETKAKETAELLAWIMNTDLSNGDNTDELESRMISLIENVGSMTNEEYLNKLDRINKLINRLVNAKSKSAKMTVLIGSAYNKDTSISVNGYYFSRGEFDESYENAAYSLDIGDISGVVTTDDGYYVIQRLELDEGYVFANLDTLKGQYQAAYINNMIEQTRASMTFEFNEYGASLDLTKIK